MTEDLSGPLVLRPRTSATVDALAASETFVRQIVTACGSPVSLLLPQAVAPNARAFETMLMAYGLKGAVYFAHKSNQSHSLLRQMAVTGLRADVASVEELRHALGCGFTGQRLEATGSKNAEFLSLCLLHGVTINLDSLQELDDLQTLRRSLGVASKARVLLRLCGFQSDRSRVLAKASRFGIRVDDVPRALRLLADCADEIELLGFAFHLDSVSLDERVVAVENCLAAYEEAVNLGMEPPSVLNIGGGFRVNYLADEADWSRYTSAISQAALGAGPQVTWQDNHFGLSAQGGILRGKLNSPSYYEPNPGAGFLGALLESELPAYGQQKMGHFLRDNMIELWLEPGRALLDQCGLTLARVIGTKVSSAGDPLVGLEMKRQDIAFLDQEVFVDPLKIGGWKSCHDSNIPVYMTGNLCLEGDLIFRHKVYLPALPEPGDLFGFVNTAAYMMDFSTTHSIMQPPARRVAAVQHSQGFTWMLDEQYTPVWHHHERNYSCS